MLALHFAVIVVHMYTVSPFLLGINAFIVASHQLYIVSYAQTPVTPTIPYRQLWLVMTTSTQGVHDRLCTQWTAGAQLNVK
jgi:hypothetical protein